MAEGMHRVSSMGHSKWLILMLVIGIMVALATPAMAGPAGPVTVDFESLTGPSIFSTADAPVALGGMTISGGQILTAATYMPANQTTIYGTSDFCSGCNRTLLAEFDVPVDGLAFDLLNGSVVEVAYSVITPYGIQIHTLAPNSESGMVRVVIPERKVLSVRIAPRDETSVWDFFLDNFAFAPRGSGAKPLYENYKWYTMSLLESAEKVEQLSLSRFVSEADSPNHDPRLNWTTDECSGPAVISVWSDEFANPCIRHDFGYRNFGSSKALDKTEDRKTQIDLLFYDDMTTICKHYHTVLRASCYTDRLLFYEAVHFTPWGHDAFFD